jgi:hypothetical protein
LLYDYSLVPQQAATIHYLIKADRGCTWSSYFQTGLSISLHSHLIFNSLDSPDNHLKLVCRTNWSFVPYTFSAGAPARENPRSLHKFTRREQQVLSSMGRDRICFGRTGSNVHRLCAVPRRSMSRRQPSFQLGCLSYCDVASHHPRPLCYALAFEPLSGLHGILLSSEHRLIFRTTRRVSASLVLTF